MFAVIFIPNFSLQSVLRHEPELRAGAIALIDPALPKPVIVQLTSVASACGVREGLTVSQAMARCGNLIIRSRSVSQENSATETLLQTAYTFSPNIEATAPGICTMELKGLGLHEDSPRRDWAEGILQILAQYYLEAKIGIARTPELALLVAHGAERISIVESADEYIVPLPIAALNPSQELSEILSRWGVRTVGEFLALGKNEVAERLGVEALELFARVSTHSVRPLKLVLPPEAFTEEMEFRNEIETAAPLLFVLQRFVEQLSRRLEAIYLVIAEFHLHLGLASGAKYERIFKIPAPTGNSETLFQMLETHLETVRTDSPIVSLKLTAVPAKPETHQFGLFECTLRNQNQFVQTLARMSALVGEENVGTPQLIPSHKPDSFRLLAQNFDSVSTRSLELKIKNCGLQLRRFRPPMPAHFEFRSEKPALVRSDILTGAIAKVRGPFFSSGNWWDANRWAREEWDVETSDGSLLRIFRSSDGCFVEGVYD